MFAKDCDAPDGPMQQWTPHQEVCGAGPANCGEVVTNTNCDPSWLKGKVQDVELYNMICVADAQYFNGYRPISQHYSLTDSSGATTAPCSGVVLATEDKTTCWNEALGKYEEQFCYNDDEAQLASDSSGGITSCTDSITNDSTLCNDPDALSPFGAPSGWFIERCCKSCGLYGKALN
jgi:hypothetical protein